MKLHFDILLENDGYRVDFEIRHLPPLLSSVNGGTETCADDIQAWKQNAVERRFLS